MNIIDLQLPVELRVLLLADYNEFPAERCLLHEVIYPALKKQFFQENNVEFNLIDAYYLSQCKGLISINTEDFLSVEFEKCINISAGLSIILLLGDNSLSVKAPSVLTTEQFTYVLTFLQQKKDPSWVIFNSKYSKDDKNSVYRMDKNASQDEIDSVVNCIYQSIEQKIPSEFPSDFIEETLTPNTLRFLTKLLKDSSKIGKTQIIHRITTNLTKEPSKSTPSKFQQKLKDNFDATIREIKRKFGTEYYRAYLMKDLLIEESKKKYAENIENLIKQSESLINPNQISSSNSSNVKRPKTLTKDVKTNINFTTYQEIFVEHVSKLILEHSNKTLQRIPIYNSQDMEIKIQHCYQINNSDDLLSKLINEERAREMEIFENYLTNSAAKMPGLIFGSVGCGKSTVISNLYRKLKSPTPDPNLCLIKRKCGLTLTSSSLQLLLNSITQEIREFFIKDYISKSNSSHTDYATSVYNFWKSLYLANDTRKLIILLDDTDILYPTSHTDLLKWLPHDLPNGVKLLMTATSESFYSGFKKRYDTSNIVSLPMLDMKECIKLFNSSTTIQLSEALTDQAKFCLQNNSKPFYLNLLIHSIDSITDYKLLTPDINELIKLYIKKIENMHYQSYFIKAVMSYLALSRFGLTLTELTDLLSLDNKVFEISKFEAKIKTSFKFPIYLIEYILGLLQDTLEYAQLENRLVIRFKNASLKEAIIEHFQLLQDEGKTFFYNLLDYWTSKYSNEKLKPVVDKFEDENDEGGDDLTKVKEGSYLYIRRFSSSQNFFFINKYKINVSNKRRISEMTNLLIQYGRVNDLNKLILFNYDYLFSILNAYNLNHVISEIYFIRQINEIKTNEEVELLLVQLRMLSPELGNDATLLAPELSGRLSHLIGQNPLMTHLHVQIDHLSPKTNVLFGVIPCFSTVSLDNLRVEIGNKNSIIFAILNFDNRFLTTFHNEESSGDYIITIWDARTANKSQIINIGSCKAMKFLEMFLVPQKDDYIVLQYEDKVNLGFMLINTEFSNIENSLKFPKKSIINVLYTSKSHLYLKVNSEIQIFNFPTCTKDHTVSKNPWPTVYTPNDRYLIGPKPPSKKDGGVNFNLRVMNGGSGENVSQISLNANAHYLIGNSRNEFLFISTKVYGLIYRFDIGQIVKKDAKKIKNNLELNLKNQNVISDDIQALIDKYYPNFRANKLTLSLDEKYIMADYDVGEIYRFVGVWNITTKALIIFKQIDVNTTIGLATDSLFVHTLTKDGILNIYALNNPSSYEYRFSQQPVQLFTLKSSNILIVFPNTLILTNVKLLINSTKQSTKESNDVENYCTSITYPEVNMHNQVVFSNDLNSPDLLFYHLKQNTIKYYDFSHRNQSLTQFPMNRIISPNGENLLMIYGFKPMVERHLESDYDVESLVLKLHENGRLISCNNNYKKPQLPNENYYLGKIKNGKNPFKDVYSHSIIKIANIKTGNFLFQVSLVGERILNFSNDELLTFKPDYASLSRKNEQAYDIISIYKISDNQLTSSIYLDHPVIESILIEPSSANKYDSNRLLVCCGMNGRILKLLGGPNFSETIYNIDIQTLLKYFDEFARTAAVNKLFVFKSAPGFVLVKHNWLEYNSNVVKSELHSYYAKIDLIKKDMISQFNTSGVVTDVSSDGALAIDSLLNIYDLNKGVVLRRIQSIADRVAEIDHKTKCFCLFSEENSQFIVVYEPCLNNLWIIKNDENCSIIGRSLLNTVSKASGSKLKYRISLCLKSRVVIAYNELEFKIFVIKLNTKSVGDINYKSSTDRINKLLYL